LPHQGSQLFSSATVPFIKVTSQDFIVLSFLEGKNPFSFTTKRAWCPEEYLQTNQPKMEDKTSEAPQMCSAGTTRAPHNLHLGLLCQQ
jgi:hypothetical protein